MKWILGIIDTILAVILVYILIYPKIQASKVVNATVLYEEGLGSLPLYVAEDQGYFDSVRVNVNLQKVMHPGEEIDKLLKGSAHVAVGMNWIDFVYKSALRPQAMKVLYSMESTIESPYTALFYVKKRRRVYIPKKINYKRFFRRHRIRVIGCLKRAKEERLMKYMLKQLGVDTRDLEFTEIDPANLDSVIAKKSVDLIVAYEPYRSYLMKMPSKVVLIDDAFFEKNIFSPYPDALGLTSVVNLKLSKKSVVRVKEALDMAINYIRKNPDDAMKILDRNLKLPDDLVFELPKIEKYDEIEFIIYKKFIDYLKNAEIILIQIDPEVYRLARQDIQ